MRIQTVIALFMLGVLAACGGKDGDQAQSADVQAEAETDIPTDAGIDPAPTDPPSWDEASNARYPGIAETVIELESGRWEGEPFVEGGASRPTAGLVSDFRLTGDLDGDGADESVFLLWTSGGGSGTFDYLAVLGRDSNGSAVTLATAGLGDRVKIRTAEIDEGRIRAETLQAGPEDAACCPGQKVERVFALQEDALAEVSTRDQGRLSVNDLAGGWRLTHLGRDEPVPEGIEISLSLDGDRIGGLAACNQYSGAVIEGESPGELYVAGPIALTRKLCPPPLMEAEQRYLGRLQNIGKFTFKAGRLVLIWSSGEPGDVGGMLQFSSLGD